MINIIYFFSNNCYSLYILCINIHVMVLETRLFYWYVQVRMAERSKALRSGRSLVLQAWVRIPLLTNLFIYHTLSINSDRYPLSHLPIHYTSCILNNHSNQQKSSTSSTALKLMFFLIIIYMLDCYVLLILLFNTYFKREIWPKTKSDKNIQCYIIDCCSLLTNDFTTVRLTHR